MNRLFCLRLFLGIMFLGSSCSEKNKMEKQIATLEKEIFSETEQSVNLDKTAQLVDTYVAFADTWPSEEKAPEYLFNAGNVAMNLLDPEKAITLFDRIMKSYPAYEKIPQCLFLKAFIFENQLNQLGKAEMLYREFLQNYPDHEFADDAELSLKNLGKTPEELLQQFEMTTTMDSTQ